MSVIKTTTPLGEFNPDDVDRFLEKFGGKIARATKPVHLAVDLFGNMYLCVHEYPMGGLVLMRHTVSVENPKPLSSKSKYRIFVAPLDVCKTYTFEDRNLILTRVGITKAGKVATNSHMDKVPISCVPCVKRSINEELEEDIESAWKLYVHLFTK